MSPMLQPKYSQILLRTAIDTSSSRRRVVIVFGEISAALHKSALLIFYRSAASAVCCNWLTAWLLYPPHIYVFVSLPVLMNTVYHIFSLFAIHFRWFLHMSRLLEREETPPDAEIETTAGGIVKPGSYTSLLIDWARRFFLFLSFSHNDFVAQRENTGQDKQDKKHGRSTSNR